MRRVSKERWLCLCSIANQPNMESNDSGLSEIRYLQYVPSTHTAYLPVPEHVRPASHSQNASPQYSPSPINFFLHCLLPVVPTHPCASGHTVRASSHSSPDEREICKRTLSLPRCTSAPACRPSIGRRSSRQHPSSSCTAFLSSVPRRTTHHYT